MDLDWGPAALRDIVCRVLRVPPDASNWSEYPNIWNEVEGLVYRCDWFRVYEVIGADRDRNRAGLALEKLLNRLFELFELQPRQPFRVVGEQIDGSFQLDGHIYLMESKWEQKPLPEADLLVFRGKIEGKSTFTRGVLIALNDVSQQARDAITRGKSPSFL